MKALKERILRDGKCFEGGILKVDNFIYSNKSVVTSINPFCFICPYGFYSSNFNRQSIIVFRELWCDDPSRFFWIFAIKIYK